MIASSSSAEPKCGVLRSIETSTFLRGILGGVFSGERWSFTCMAALAAVLGFGACFVWPPIQKAIAALTGFLAASGNIGLFLYGFLERLLIPTGLHIALPAGYEAQVRPRSGMALKHGIGVLNSPGTIDADYRGEIGIILVNLSNDPFVVNDGDRIAQMVIARHERVEWVAMESLDETQRGTGGFGHTGRG